MTKTFEDIEAGMNKVVTDLDTAIATAHGIRRAFVMTTVIVDSVTQRQRFAVYSNIEPDEAVAMLRQAVSDYDLASGPDGEGIKSTAVPRPS